MFSSPPPTWMFRFGGFASPHRVMPCLRMAGCPIRTPADLRPFAPPRRLSRPAASFIASGSQGILRAPSLASRSSVSTRSLVSVFLPSCQRTAQGESLLRVGCAGTIPPRRGPRPHSPCPSRSVPASTGPVLDSPACPSRKEVFQPHLPVRLPCYDLAPVTPFALDGSSPASGARGSHGLTGGVYKARERIHRAMADARLLAIPASRSRVADSDPDCDRLSGSAPPRGVASLCAGHCSTCVAPDVRAVLI